MNKREVWRDTAIAARGRAMATVLRGGAGPEPARAEARVPEATAPAQAPHGRNGLATGVVLCGVLGLLGLAACAPGETPRSGAQVYQESCSGCHGPAGRGVAAPGEAPALALTGLSRANGGVFPRAAIIERIDGYHRPARQGGAVMPEMGALFAGPTRRVDRGDGITRIVPVRLLALMAWLETIQTH